MFLITKEICEHCRFTCRNCKRTDNVWGYEGSVFRGIIEVGESLVLMEDALRDLQLRKIGKSNNVLILVLMEDALRADAHIHDVVRERKS